MISITIDVTIFDLSEYYNVKMHNFKFFGNGEHPYILWSVNDHEIPNTLRINALCQNCIYQLYTPKIKTPPLYEKRGLGIKLMVMHL